MPAEQHLPPRTAVEEQHSRPRRALSAGGPEELAVDPHAVGGGEDDRFRLDEAVEREVRREGVGGERPGGPAREPDHRLERPPAVPAEIGDPARDRHGQGLDARARRQRLGGAAGGEAPEMAAVHIVLVRRQQQAPVAIRDGVLDLKPAGGERGRGRSPPAAETAWKCR